ncbi:hypothetical protein LDENG_00206900 [Lucifuga dentata]|nr:hypothetical protein LDENG_00206900 [Lucifuga dentata]
MCCEGRLHAGAGLLCCGKLAFNPGNATCCTEPSGRAKITEGLSHKVSACCGLNAYNPLNEICSEELAIVVKPGPKANWCGKVVYDEEKQICCGEKIQIRESSKHLCCKNATCKMTKTPETKHCTIHTEPNSRLCSLSCYNPLTKCCCQKNQSHLHQRYASGGCAAGPQVYDPNTQICCDGCLFGRQPWTDQCCGGKPYGLAQRGVLCCNNTLYRDVEDGMKCSDSGILYNPDEWMMCHSPFRVLPGRHCCGKETYQPHAEICCNGHRHTKTENIYCCGVHAYNISDPKLKCCAGTLHNLGMDGGDLQCCGSILMTNPLDVCCSSEDEELLYSAQTGFRCCGDSYYNTSLWSCCAEWLSPARSATPHRSNTIKESRFLSLNNLNKTQLCNGMHIGIVESVSVNDIVLSSVLKIHGTNAAVTHLAWPYILKIPDRCNAPKLTPGKTYFFDEETFNFFTEFNRYSVLQSLHFIISKCALS